MGRALPGPCTRNLNSPSNGEVYGGCPEYCAGRTNKPDDVCLCDTVHAAWEQGKEWRFEIDERTGEWVYVGEPLD
jgi:hypothetical protein